MAGLQAKERHGQFGGRGVTQRLAGRAIQTGRDVDGDDPLGGSQRIGDKIGQWTGQSGAEYRVDDDVRSSSLRRGERDHGAEPQSGGTRGVGVRTRRRKGGDADGPALLGKQPSGHVAVATIIAGAGKDQDSASFYVALDGAGNGAAGSLHQDKPRVSMSCGGLIRTSHLVGREQSGAAVEARDQVGINVRHTPGM
jgi:hypothetical protein